MRSDIKGNTKAAIAAIVIYFYTSPVFSLEDDTTSTITLPIDIELDYIQNKIQSALPSPLVDLNSQRQVCVKATWFKSKGVPKCSFKGIKLYCKDSWIRTKATPDISCETEGWVRRSGPLTITGSGNTLNVSLPLSAQMSAKNIGNLIKSETVNAEATINASATIDLDKQWNPIVSINPEYQWDKQPTLELFDLIPITLAEKVEPELEKILDKEKVKFPDYLKSLKVQQTVRQLWNDVQEPIKINADPATFLLVKPLSASFSGFNTLGNKLSTKISLKIETAIVVSNVRPSIEKKALPTLIKHTLLDDSFILNIPVHVKLIEIENSYNRKFPNGFDMPLDELKLPGTVNLSNLVLDSENDSIKIKMNIKREISDFIPPIEGIIQLIAKPRLDVLTQTLTLESVSIDSESGGFWFNKLSQLATIPLIEDKLTKHISYDLNNDLKTVRELFSGELNPNTHSSITIRGSLDNMQAQSLLVSGGYVAVNIITKGKLRALVKAD